MDVRIGTKRLPCACIWSGRASLLRLLHVLSNSVCGPTPPGPLSPWSSRGMGFGTWTYGVSKRATGLQACPTGLQAHSLVFVFWFCLPHPLFACLPRLADDAVPIPSNRRPNREPQHARNAVDAVAVGDFPPHPLPVPRLTLPRGSYTLYRKLRDGQPPAQAFEPGPNDWAGGAQDAWGQDGAQFRLSVVVDCLLGDRTCRDRRRAARRVYPCRDGDEQPLPVPTRRLGNGAFHAFLSPTLGNLAHGHIRVDAGAFQNHDAYITAAAAVFIP